MHSDPARCRYEWHANRISYDNKQSNHSIHIRAQSVAIFAHNLRPVIIANGCRQTLGVQRQSLRHSEAPMVAHLSAQIQIQIDNQQTVGVARQSRRAFAIRCRHECRPEKWSEFGVRRFAVARRERVRKLLGAHAIDGHRVVAVGDGRIACLNRPQRFAQTAHLELG